MKKTGTIIIVSILLLTACTRRNDGRSSATWTPATDEQRSIAIEAMKVQTGYLVDTVRTAGTANGIRDAWVVAETEGTIRRMNIRLGDSVAANEILLATDGDLAARNRDLTRAQYDTVLLEYKATEQSKESGNVSELQFSQIKDKLLSAKNAWASALETYENTMLKAPFAGVVVARASGLDVGNYLTRGTRVVRIVDYSAWRTEVSVGEGQISLIREGDRARIVGKDGRIREGRISEVSGGSNVGTGSFTVVAEWNSLDNDNLKSGMTVDVEIEVSAGVEHVLAPFSSVRIRGGQEYIFVVKDEKVENRQIKTGNRIGEMAEILSGLQDGEIIATSGIASLTPQSTVVVTLIDPNRAQK